MAVNGEQQPQRGVAAANRSSNGSYRHSRRDIYAALDLGTNNCRLLVAKPVHGGFRVIDAFSRIVRLGEGLNASGSLSAVAMDRAIEALSCCAEKISRRNVTRLRSVATEACRVAGNSAEFVSRVHEATGIALDIITPAEEARLAVLGCLALIEAEFEHALIFDIGGGSTEVIWARLNTPGEPQIERWVSLPYGVVNLAEEIDTRAVSEAEYAGILKRVTEGLAPFADCAELTDAVSRGKVQFMGTSGTVTTLMSVSLGLPSYDRAKVDGGWVARDQIRQIARDIAFMSAAQREQHPCIGEERADLVVPGCAVFEAVLNAWPIERLRVADRGIREGVLRGLMQRDPLVNAARTTAPAPQQESTGA